MLGLGTCSVPGIRSVPVRADEHLGESLIGSQVTDSRIGAVNRIGRLRTQLIDKDGNETDYTLIKWGPGGVWGFEELERNIQQVLPDYEGHDVTMDLDDQPLIIYNDIPLKTVDEFVKRGLIVESYQFGCEALDLMRRNPDARLGAMVACSWDGEASWYAVVRGVRLQEKEPTVADLAACQDMSRTFLLPTDEGHRLAQSCMVAWFASDMASADVYDWRGDSYGDLARAHELPIPTMGSAGAGAEGNSDS